MPLGTALPLAEELLMEIRETELVERADVAGSVRRRRETIGDIDILITSRDSARALKELTQLLMAESVVNTWSWARLRGWLAKRRHRI